MAAYAALVSLMHIIDRIQLHTRPPIVLQHKQIELLTRKATYLQEFLKVCCSDVSYTTEPDPFESRIADLAYAAEDLIESHIVDNITNQGKSLDSAGLREALEKVIEEMDGMEKEAMRIEETMGDQRQLLRVSTIPPSSRPSSMVGVDDLLLEVMDKLTGGEVDLQIIPIVGMGGIGKTALASNVFQNPLIKEYFHICAWVTISQQYSLREIFGKILRQFGENRLRLSGEELGEKLYRHLFGRRYLIILDDIWSNEALDEIRIFFPDNKNGSRILITTRLSNLVSNNRFEMKFLDEANSWTLLSRIVFHNHDSCPLELEEIGKRIAKSCKGLPLSIVVVGGCLAGCKLTRKFWDHIEQNLNSVLNLEDNERCLRTLYMSYKYLPIYVKPCFLYMGVFPEDKAIRVSKLIKLWVAEGFVKPITGKSLEDAARVYLKDLVGRNLIMIHEVGSIGNIKYCKIHDLLRDLCIREAEKERFYIMVRPNTPPQGMMNGQRRRIVISSCISHEEMANPIQSESVARSLIWNVHETLPPLRFRLLRILSTSRAAHSLENVFQLVNWKYVDISTDGWGLDSVFSSSFHLLWNIQTLIFDGYVPMTAPTEIWNMPQIRHIQFSRLYLPDPPTDGIVLGNLQTLATIKDLICSKEKVRRVPNLKKLRASNTIRDLSNLAHLHKLESFSFYAFPKGGVLVRIENLEFPHSLKKLSLRIGYMQCWEEDILKTIGALPLLEKLKLSCGYFGGRRWETREGQFCSLKFLEINECQQLHIWKTESSHFPCLERLVLQRLRLNEIPLDFADIPTLGLIELKFCEESAAKSAKRIIEEQEELCGEVRLQVQVMMHGKSKVVERLASSNFHVRCL